MSFPGLEQCEHGEYIDRECLRCEVERLRSELSRRNLSGVNSDVLVGAAREFREENVRLRGEIKTLRAEVERLRGENEADFIIAVYRGFQSAIGSGETYLSCRDWLWRVDWESPRIQDRKRFAGRFEFDARIGALEMQHGEEIGRRWAEKFRDELQASVS